LAVQSGQRFVVDSTTDERDQGELYDLKNDPGERVNRINDAAAAARPAALKQALNRLMMAAGVTPQSDQMPIDQGIKKELPDQKIR